LPGTIPVLCELQSLEFSKTSFEKALAAGVKIASMRRTCVGWSDDIGAIEVAKYAGLIAVDGNVLDDIKQLEHVKFVMKRRRSGGQRPREVKEVASSALSR
jgi:hypothetical protein